MAITVTLQQTATGVGVVWESDEADPAAGFEIGRDINPPNAPAPVGTTSGDNKLFIDQISAGEIADGDVLEYTVEDLDTTTTGTAQLTYIDAAQWTTIAAVRTMLGPLEAGFTDDQITAAIVSATARLDSVFCVDVAVDDVTGLPTNINVQTATTVMASRILVAPATGVPPVQGGQITSERMGSYSYSVRPGTAPTNSSAYTIDGVIKDLVGGYVCPGVAGYPTQTDIWPYAAPSEEAIV